MIHHTGNLFNHIKRFNLNRILNPDSWIISGWKRQGRMKQEVMNVGKFSTSTPYSGSNYLLYSVESIKYSQHFNIQ